MIPAGAGCTLAAVPPPVIPLPFDPAAPTSQRPAWGQLPEPVRQRVAELTGQPVVAAASSTTGFSRAFAGVADLADGQRVFLKAASGPGAALLDAEAVALEVLPGALPIPRLLATGTVRTEGPRRWSVVVLEHVDGFGPGRPWRPEQLQAALDVLTDLDARLDGVRASRRVTGWVTPLSASGPRYQSWAPPRAPADLAELGVWARHIDVLAQWEARWVEELHGQGWLSHFDVRSDNFLLTGSGARLCDWAHLCLAPRWLDVAALLVEARGDGHDSEQLMACHPVGRHAGQGALDAYLAATAGVLHESSRRRLRYPGDPLRAMQAWTRDACLAWLADRHPRLISTS